MRDRVSITLSSQRSLVVLPGHAFHNPGFDVSNFILGDFTLKPGCRIAFAIQNAPLTFCVPVIINVAIPGGIVGLLVVEMTDTNQARNAMQGVVNLGNQVSGLGHLSGSNGLIYGVNYRLLQKSSQVWGYSAQNRVERSPVRFCIVRLPMYRTMPENAV
jgi:hypothetical protein